MGIHRNEASALVLTTLFTLVSACGDEPGGDCVAGTSISCSCTDGRAGAQVCEANGTFGECVCSDAGITDGAATPAIVRTAPSAAEIHTNDTVAVQFIVAGAPELVELLLDGSALVILEAPYAYEWDTRSIEEGPHELVGRVTHAGEQTRAEALTVHVDRTAPHVVARTPASNASNVWIREPIVIEFSEPLRPNSVNDATVSISAGEATNLAKSLALSEDGTRVSILLDADPSFPATISVSVLAALEDLAGNHLLPDAWNYEMPAWQMVGGGPIEGDVAFVAGPYSLASSQDRTTMCACLRGDGSSSDPLRVLCSEGGEWTQRGPALDESGNAQDALAEFDGDDHLVVVWRTYDTASHTWPVHAARWDDAAWSALGGPLPPSWSAPQLALHDGSIFVGYAVSHTGVEVRAWNGSAWSLVGPPLSVGTAANVSLAVLDTGDPLIAVGGEGGHVYRFDRDADDWMQLGLQVDDSHSGDLAAVRVMLDPEAVPVALTRTELFRWHTRLWVKDFGFYVIADQPARLAFLPAGDLVEVHGRAGSTYVQHRMESETEQLGMFADHTPYGLRLDDRDHPVILTRSGGDVFAYRLNAL